MYKSIKYNKEVILIDEKLTSKTCSCCGKIKYDLILSDRIYNCLCGNSIDRDRNAAINMKLLGSSNLENRFVPVME
jgi:putative transposase